MKTLAVSGLLWQGERASIIRFGNPATWLMAGAGVYLALVPSLHLVPGLSPFDAKRVLELGLLLLNAGVLLGSRSLRTAWIEVVQDLPAAARVLIATLFVLGTVSAMGASLPRYALLDVAHYALLGCLAVTVAALYRQSRGARATLFLAFVVAGIAFYLLSVAVGYVVGRFYAVPVWPQTNLGFSHIRFFNHYQTWTLPLVVLPALLVRNQARVAAGLLAGVAAGWWMLLFASGGRGTALSVAVGIVFTFLLFRRTARSWALAQFASMIAGAVLFYLFFQVLAPGTDSFLERNLGTDSERFMIWGHAWGLARAHPFLGIGPMHLAYTPLENNVAHPHNVLLQWTAEWGIPAAIILLVVAVWGLLRWVRFARRAHENHPLVPHRFYLVALTATLVAAAVHSQLCGLVVTPLSQVLAALTVGWALGIYQLAECPPNRFGPVRGGWQSAGLCAALILIAGVWTWGFAPDVYRLPEREKTFIRQTKPATIYPRFWQQGYIMEVRTEAPGHAATPVSPR